MDRAFAFHNNSRGRRGTDFAYRSKGLNVRMPEFQAALLLSQMTRLSEQMQIREENAKYLTSMLNEIPGIRPAKMYAHCTRNAYHLYMFRYNPAEFSGLSRDKFLKALSAEGIPASAGYSPLNREPVFRSALESRGYQRIYSAREIAQWQERNECPANDRLCAEAVWFTQTMLLGPRQDMNDIVAAIQKVQRFSDDLARS